MSKKVRRSFTPEFKASAVELVRTSGTSIGQSRRLLASPRLAFEAG